MTYLLIGLLTVPFTSQLTTASFHTYPKYWYELGACVRDTRVENGSPHIGELDGGS